VLWAPLLVFWFWWIWRMTHSESLPMREALRWMLSFAIVSGLLCSIWWVRNCIVLGGFSPLGTKGSVTLLGGYCDEAYERGGEWQGGPELRLRMELESERPKLTTANDALQLELDLAKAASTRVREWTLQHCASMPLLFAKRIITEWNPYHGKALVLKLFALIGAVWLARFHRVGLVWLVGPLAINTLIVMITYSVGGRFLVPTYGTIYILAAFGFAGPLSQILSKTKRSTIGSTTAKTKTEI
jgi:hypothetical protein